MAKHATVNTIYWVVCLLLKENGKNNIFLKSAMRHFTSLNLELVNIMSLKNEKRKKLLIINFLKDKKNK